MPGPRHAIVALGTKEPAIAITKIQQSAAPTAYVLLAVIVCAGLAIWLWIRRADSTRAQRGRSRQAAWSIALVIVAAMLTATLYSILGHRQAIACGPGQLNCPKTGGSGVPIALLLLLIPVAVLLILALKPKLAASIVPAALIVLGLLGFLLVRLYGFDSDSPLILTVHGFVLDWYGFTPIPTIIVTKAAAVSRWGQAGDAIILAQAYLFVLLGGWLGWRELRHHPITARLLLGKMAPGGASGQPWGLLLLPLTLALAVLGVRAWWVVLLLAVSVLMIRRWPRLAGQLAAVGIMALGVLGLVAAQGWYLSRGGALVVAPGMRAAQVGGRGDALFGMVVVTNQGTRILAELEGVILIGLGCWLVPRTFPAVGRLLGLAPNLQLTRQLQRLTESRAVVVDTAASDLRRLERDLHDGAQARLVALGMNLRAAERLIPVNPDAALALVAEARHTSARALIELRELVRGVHPPVLADRGLADAVRALALDCPLGVETDIDLPGRPPAPVETACYFAVAELLTNAAKHSGAHQARVDVRYSDGRLRVEVTDFGLGGADPAAGTGLIGVEKRLAAFDGIMAISSPAGGPTIVALEVPCALSSPKTSTC